MKVPFFIMGKMRVRIKLFYVYNAIILNYVKVLACNIHNLECDHIQGNIWYIYTVQQTWLNYNAKSQTIWLIFFMDPLQRVHVKSFVTPMFFKLLTRFWCQYVRIRQKSIGEGFNFIERALRVLYNTAFKNLYNGKLLLPIKWKQKLAICYL